MGGRLIQRVDLNTRGQFICGKIIIILLFKLGLIIKCLCASYNITFLKLFGSMSWDRNGIGSCHFIVQCSVRRNEAVQLVDRLYNFAKITFVEKRSMLS